MNKAQAHKNKFLALVVLAALALSGCASTQTQNISGNAQTNVKTAQDYHLSWNKHDANAVSAWYVPDGSFTNPAGSKPFVGQKAIADRVGATFAAMPDFQVETTRITPISDKTVVHEWTIKGTWTQPFPGGPFANKTPTGKSFSVPGVSVFEIENGKIKSEILYYDRMSFLTQIGAM
jgi:steroid delta-isomerase-like uncharacterized protein